MPVLEKVVSKQPPKKQTTKKQNIMTDFEIQTTNLVECSKKISPRTSHRFKAFSKSLIKSIISRNNIQKKYC